MKRKWNGPLHIIYYKSEWQIANVYLIEVYRFRVAIFTLHFKRNFFFSGENRSFRVSSIKIDYGICNKFTILSISFWRANFRKKVKKKIRIKFNVSKWKNAWQDASLLRVRRFIVCLDIDEIVKVIQKNKMCQKRNQRRVHAVRTEWKFGKKGRAKWKNEERRKIGKRRRKWRRRRSRIIIIIIVKAAAPKGLILTHRLNFYYFELKALKRTVGNSFFIFRFIINSVLFACSSSPSVVGSFKFEERELWTR